MLLPVTAWLAWNELERSSRPLEVVADKSRMEFIPSTTVRLPLRLWQEFASPNPAFSVRMPGIPQLSEESDVKANGGGAKTWSLALDRAPGGAPDLAFHVSWFTIANPETPKKFQGTLHWLTCLQAQDFPDLQKCAVRPLRKNGADGGEFFLEFGDAQAVRRAYVHRSNVYYLTCTGTNLNRYKADWRLFMDSFEFKKD